MTTNSHNSRVSFIRSRNEVILRHARSGTAQSAQVADTKMAAQMANILVSYELRSPPAIMLQRATNAPVADRHANYLPVSVEDDELLYYHDILHIPCSEAQKMIDFAMLRCEEITLRRLTDGVIQHTMETFLNITTKESRKLRKLLVLSTKLWEML